MSRQVDDQTFEKRQGSLKDYTTNWGDNWLGTDTLASSSWVLDSPLAEVTNTFTDDNATVWVSGGTVGQTHQMMNTIVTAGGRIDSRPTYLRIIEDDA